MLWSVNSPVERMTPEEIEELTGTAAEQPDYEGGNIEAAADDFEDLGSNENEWEL